MCGRYAAGKATDDLVEELEIEADHTRPAAADAESGAAPGTTWSPQYNVAPTATARVALTRAARDAAPGGEGEGPAETAAVRQLRLLTWGLVPSWAKDRSAGVKMTNARAETVLTKPAFRRAARSRRCLVPADGWYEWQSSPVAVDAKGRPRKQPFFMRRTDGGSATFAGLYEFWRDPAAGEGDPAAWLATFTIVTTAAEPGLDRIHDRQPLVLDPDQWGAWLDPALDDERLTELLTTSRPGRFEAYPVGRAVGNSRVDGAHLLDPAPAHELQGVVDPSTGEVVGG